MIESQRNSNSPGAKKSEDKTPGKITVITACLGKMVHVVALGLPAFIIWLAQPGSSLFSWHPTLMAIGFCFLMMEAILIFSPQSSLFPTLPRTTKSQWHWIIQIGAILSAYIGFGVILYNKKVFKKNHFTSWHGVFGLITIILLSLQAFQGIGIFYPRFSLLNMKLGQRKQLHALSGALVFALACFTLVLGLFSSWFIKVTNEATWWGSVMSAFSLAGIVIGQVVNEYLAKKKT